ncbi:hypothetical protein GGR50DRAFT_645155 [Xylaria sp. CBS 124048]|nr:hypothetical protein GGR50DRAFT_645155 [Xylaria sp. CBS 124048]
MEWNMTHVFAGHAGPHFNGSQVRQVVKRDFLHSGVISALASIHYGELGIGNVDGLTCLNSPFPSLFFLLLCFVCFPFPLTRLTD